MSFQLSNTNSILSFQKPNRVFMKKSDQFNGNFEFKPLEAGFGITIGNAIRRILLSSLEGFAITSVKINNILHEFTTVKGVVEDITEIVLNLKKVCIKKVGELGINEKLIINITDQETFSAADIFKHSTNFQATNPDLIICHLDKTAALQLEINITKGRGYRTAEENTDSNASIGVIPIDSIFSPIISVDYNIENYRIEQITDYEKLNINIETDGTILPEDALKEAAKILIQHFMLFSDENITIDKPNLESSKDLNEEMLRLRKILQTNLDDLDLSVRALNCLKAANIKTLANLVSYDIVDMLKFRNFGKKSLTEIEELVKSKGLTFGMNISKFQLDKEI